MALSLTSKFRAGVPDAIRFKANIGRISNLTLRQVGGEGIWYGIDITQGRLELEGCDISSRELDVRWNPWRCRSSSSAQSYPRWPERWCLHR